MSCIKTWYVTSQQQENLAKHIQRQHPQLIEYPFIFISPIQGLVIDKVSSFCKCLIFSNFSGHQKWPAIVTSNQQSMVVLQTGEPMNNI